MNGRFVSALAVVFLLDVSPAASWAQDTKAQGCADSYENSQVLRKKGELLAAREAMKLCARSTCHQAIRSECVDWLTEVERGIPTVVVRARDAGMDVFDVRVLIDGKEVATSISGKAIEVEPGAHIIVAEHGKKPPITRQVLLAEGSKNQFVDVSWDEPKPAYQTGGAPDKQEAPTPMERPVPALTYVFAGVSVAAFATSVFFWRAGLSKHDDLKTSCAPFCQDGDVSGVKTNIYISDAALGLGVASLATSAYLLFTRPERPVVTQETVAKTLPPFAISPSSQGLVAQWRGVF